MESNGLPLAGIRVLDLSRVLAGPYCGTLLSMLGADVIKVEDKKGDEAREWPPHGRDLGTPYLAMNLNKRGMVIDLQTEDGKQIVRDLVPRVDVLIENFKTGTMERFGIGYEELRPLNPRLVYTSISAFGRQGFRANDLGYEALLQAYSGPMSMTGMADGEPARCGVSFLDMATGIYSALATVTALFHRHATGKGMRVDASLLQTALGLMSYQVANFLLDGVVPSRLGSAHPMVVPYQAIPTADGHLFFAAANQNLYERLCKGLEREDLAGDERFKSNASRVEHREELLAILYEEFAKYSTDDLIARFKASGLPCTRVNNVRDLMEDGQVEQLGALVELEDPEYGKMRFTGLPFKLDGKPGQAVRRAPRLGEHTREILQEIGYDEARIGALIDQNVIVG
ncbi:MAG: CoA transferase [SAR324 cluster bacterium]|nr:CoA transferase [SAR324 cluster bacterium]MCZ6627314.1 CoA transferase [SAR324 cluster bacterium]MCZ6729265.1 CoA transferase [SAR324 cluster bacterium]